MFDKLIAHKNWEDSPTITRVFAPGRIEVLGKHTDYAGGSSVTCAVHLGIYFISKETTDRIIRIESASSKETLELDLEGNRMSGSAHWMIYPEVLVNRILKDFPSTKKGIHVTLDADLPQAAGMSSSSALMVGLFLVLRDTWGLSSHPAYIENIKDRLQLGEYLGAAENGLNYGRFPARDGVGTFGGSQDQVAILCSEPDSLGLYSYLPTIKHRSVKLPKECVFVVASSGVHAEKTGNALEQYNRASIRAKRVFEILNKEGFEDFDTLGSILGSGDNAKPEQIVPILRSSCDLEESIDLSNRYTQFFQEIREIIPKFLAAAEDSDLAEIGKQVDRSQLLTETMLGNQVDETIFLAQSARVMGAIASSAFGGGFGGSVWSMVKVSEADDFLRTWREGYLKRYPEKEEDSLFFIARASKPAEIVVGPL